MASSSEPQGEWDAASRTLTWRIERLPAGSAPLAFKADFRTGGEPPAARSGRPLVATFTCDTCNLTGVLPRPTAAAPVGKVLNRFVSGKYTVHCAPPNGGSGGGGGGGGA